jgi:hypothetical protein
MCRLIVYLGTHPANVHGLHFHQLSEVVVVHQRTGHKGLGQNLAALPGPLYPHHLLKFLQQLLANLPARTAPSQ